MFKTKFSGHKTNLGRHCPRMRRRGYGAGGPKLVNGLSKSRCTVAFLTPNITNFLFYQRRRNSGRAGGTVEKFMAMEMHLKNKKNRYQYACFC